MASNKTDSQARRLKAVRSSRFQSAVMALLSTTDKVRKSFESVCAPFGITGQQYNVLRILRGSEPRGLPTLTIAERMIESTPGITRMIDRLEAKGLVKRKNHPHDRRSIYCRITDEGLELLQKLDKPIEKANRDAFRGLDSTALEQLVELLEKMQISGRNKRQS